MGKPRTMGADGEDCTFATRDTSVALGMEGRPSGGTV